MQGRLIGVVLGLALTASVGSAWAAVDTSKPQVSGFVKFNVADQDKMATFYEKAFGLTLQKVAVDSPS